MNDQTVYAKVGENALQVGGQPLEGWIEMQGPRPDDESRMDYTAQADGTWAITAETLRARAAIVEDAWRLEEMAFIANNLLYIEDENDLATPPLVQKTWRNYRKEVMAWADGNPNFPDQQLRPIRPE